MMVSYEEISDHAYDLAEQGFSPEEIAKDLLDHFDPYITAEDAEVLAREAVEDVLYVDWLYWKSTWSSLFD